MDEKNKALSDVTATPTLHSSGFGALGSSGNGFFSPPLWSNSPHLGGGNHGSFNGAGTSGLMQDGLSPGLWLAAGPNGGAPTGMTPFSEVLSPSFYRSPTTDLMLTPGFSGLGAPATPAQAHRKNAIRNEFMNVRCTEEKLPVLNSCGVQENNPMSSPLFEAATKAQTGGRQTFPPPLPHLHQPPRRPRGMMPYESTLQPQVYPLTSHGGAPAGPSGPGLMPVFPTQHDQGIPYDMCMGQPKPELILQHDYHQQQMRGYVQPPNDAYRTQHMTHVKQEVAYVPAPALRGKIIAKKETQEVKESAEEVIDKKLQKQIRSRAAASRQRSRQRDYLTKLTDYNVQLRKKVDVLLQQNERLRLDIRLGGQPQAITATGPDKGDESSA